LKEILRTIFKPTFDYILETYPVSIICGYLAQGYIHARMLSPLDALALYLSELLVVQHMWHIPFLFTSLNASRFRIDKSRRPFPRSEVGLPCDEHMRMAFEDVVHVLQGSSAGFGIQAIHDREIGVTKDGEDCVFRSSQ